MRNFATGSIKHGFSERIINFRDIIPNINIYKNALFDLESIVSAQSFDLPDDLPFRLEYSFRTVQVELPVHTGNAVAVSQAFSEQKIIICTTPEALWSSINNHYRDTFTSSFSGFFQTNSLKAIEGELKEKSNDGEVRKSELIRQVLLYVKNKPTSQTAIAYRKACELIYKENHAEVLSLENKPVALRR